MIVDYKFLEDILAGIEIQDKPLFCSAEIAFYLFEPEVNDVEEYLYFKQGDIDKLYYHFQLLFDQECIVRAITVREIDEAKQPSTAQVIRVHSEHDAGFDVESSFSIKFNDDRLRLTNKGHNLLISLKDNAIMKKVTESGGKIAIDSLIGVATALGTKVLAKVIQ